MSAFVLDFSDAFWQIPISPAEEKHFCDIGLIDEKRKWIAFQRAAQGSAAAPTLWGRLAALIMRLTQSLFEPTMRRMMAAMMVLYGMLSDLNWPSQKGSATGRSPG